MSEGARAVLAQHGKSFRFAGAFLSDTALDDAAVAYAFCRAVDDAVDEAASTRAAAEAVVALQAEVSGTSEPRPVVRDFLVVCARTGLDPRFAHELLNGMADDAAPTVVFHDDQTLLRYCYRAAGTVGGMMCAVLGVRAKEALPFAIDLGVGMQLTNICRDVVEDAARGRVYLPQQRLSKTPDAVVDVVRDLLALAERYYASGEQGLRFIPWRSRLAVLIAGRLYRGIGRKLLRLHGDPRRGRVSTTVVEKIVIACGGLLSVFFLPRRGSHDASLHAALSGLPGCEQRVGGEQPRLQAQGYAPPGVRAP